MGDEPREAAASHYCTFRPVAGDPQLACSACQHALTLHIGVKHCPVCELVDLNDKARDRVIGDGRIEVHLQGAVLTEADLLAAIRRSGPHGGYGRY